MTGPMVSYKGCSGDDLEIVRLVRGLLQSCCGENDALNLSSGLREGRSQWSPEA